MKVLLSPAKSLDFETPILTEIGSDIRFPEKAQQVNAVLRKKSPNQLKELMGISESLAVLNYERNQLWSSQSELGKNRPAVFAFNGEVYRGLNVSTLSESKHELMQNTLRILSGQYGLLRPLDKIMPYRLEMGTKLAIGKSKNLYEFWQSAVTSALNEELENCELIVNLASNEYAKCLDFKSIKNRVITPIFKENKNGVYKVLSVYAKYARGLMARYIIEQNVNTIDDLKAFNLDGYHWAADLSNEEQLVFIR
jgi:cytoplasmic iron level regulating protein YaaA (DUF328/UPF0246 family)